ncbi:MAG: T9SS type A sorting domain-containing protein, partial [Bacteroidota bacterium]
EAVCANTVGFPNDAAEARVYIDSIVKYLAPRMNVVFEANNVGIEDDLLRQDLQVFPNPARDLVTIRTRSAQALESVQLMDLSGRVVRQVEAARGDVQIQRGNLASGIYVLQVRSLDAMTTVKVRFD